MPGRMPDGMDRNTRIEIRGEVRTAAEWARLNGLAVATIVRRVDQGWNPADAATFPLRSMSDATTLTIGGRTQTIDAWAVEAGIEPVTLRRRLYRGWSPERAVSAPIQRHVVTAHGETRTLSEWSERSGVAVTTICERLARGWDPERAVTEPARGFVWRGDALAVHGETLPLSEWSKRFGVPVPTISARLRRGWDPERAVSTPVRTYRRRD